MSRPLTIIGITGGAYTYENGEKVYTGVKRVGKDTLADIIKEEYAETHEVVILRLAGPIKEWFESNYHLDRSHYDNDQNKESKVTDDWTYRLLLEKFGTDVVRDGLGLKVPMINSKQFWIQKVIDKIDRLRMSPLEKATSELFNLSDDECFAHHNLDIIPRFNKSRKELETTLRNLLEEHKFPPLPSNDKPIIVIIPDVRFFNEFSSIAVYDLLMLRIERFIDTKPTGAQHPSNTVDLKIPAIMIENNGSLDELKQTSLRIVHSHIKV